MSLSAIQNTQSERSAATIQNGVSRYRLPDGRILFISDGISNGRCWFTATRIPDGSVKRFLRTALPTRLTYAAAQADLDEYAASEGLQNLSSEPKDSEPFDGLS
jgi:hypothetical protein